MPEGGIFSTFLEIIDYFWAGGLTGWTTGGLSPLGAPFLLIRLEGPIRTRIIENRKNNVARMIVALVRIFPLVEPNIFSTAAPPNAAAIPPPLPA